MCYVKNIDMFLIEQYNKDFQYGNAIYDYMKGNLIHLEEDINRFTKKGYSQFQLKKFTDLHAVCVSIQDKVTYRKPLAEHELKAFDDINRYNSAKNTEMKRLAVLTAIFAILGVVISFLFK